MMRDETHPTIMIVDDEPESLNALGAILRQEGWGIRAFPRGEIAIAAARDEPPDLVLLDVQMPDMDGYEVCRRFKADESLSPIPIIFLFAVSEPVDKAYAFKAGGVDYVTKPFSEIEVLARTHTHLRMRRHQLHLEDLVSQRIRELMEAHRRLRIWDDARNHRLNILSHEMSTPLTGIFSIAELLFMRTPPDSSQIEMRTCYDLSCASISKLINDAQTLAQIDVASETFNISPVKLMPILRNVLESLTSKAPDNAIRAATEALEPVTVLAERNLLGRAFFDLLFTASCCVSADESITLDTHVSSNRVSVVIATGGRTLSSDALETFFDVGGQRTLLKGGGDFGLGCALASRILKLFNGRVSVRNGSDRGLVMEITLPV